MSNKNKKILTILLSCSLLTSCDDSRVFQQTGEWKCEDLIYIKNQGTSEHECDPIGWVMINNEKVDCKLNRQPGRQVEFLYYDTVNETEGEMFWWGSAKLLLSGNIRLKIERDYTGTNAENTKYILEKLNS